MVYSSISCAYRPTNDTLKLHDQGTSYAGEKPKVQAERFIMPLM